ncbi:MAG: glycosyltransferase family 39 protein [Candidatus Gastranaerophilales bacterium]|nr:glycosyltransferase family 39 protein [Candidatus Gastranaerophilales bacterium]
MIIFDKHKNVIYICILFVICFLLYCTNIASYPFIDTDETKFVSIAKDMLNYSDWLNIKLNGENIYDLTPLFFWITNLSCLIFGKISSEAVRLPISLISTAGIIILYYCIKNILTKTYALIISLIMATCLGVMVFSRLATNDIIFCIITMIVILNSYLALTAKEGKSTLKYRIFMYIFWAFDILCSGLFGLFIPLFSILSMYIFAGKLKDIFNLKNIITGLIILMVLVLPWNIIMVHKYGYTFIKESLITCNFLKYIGFKELLSVFGLFILGFSPWSFSFMWILGRRFKDIINSFISYFKDNSQDKLKEKWLNLNKTERFLSLNIIVFFTSLVFTILYGSKYTYLILFLMFPSSCLSGHYWYEYIIKKKHDKSIFFATMIPNLILIICSLAGLFGHNILNKWIFQGLNHLIIPLIIIFFVIPVISIFAVILKGRIVPYAANLILMISLSFVLTPSIFNFISLNGGENDLINYARLANNDNVVLAAYIPSKKYSLVYYYDKPVIFHSNNDINWIDEYLKNNPLSYVVVEIKDLWTIEENKINYMLLDAGKRYCLIQYMNFEQENKENDTEPEIIVY